LSPDVLAFAASEVQERGQRAALRQIFDKIGCELSRVGPAANEASLNAAEGAGSRRLLQIDRRHAASRRVPGNGEIDRHVFLRNDLRLVLLAAAVAIATPAMAATAARPNGYPVTSVNLRAGPGTDYPVILTVPARAPISILGCLGDYT
jgi:hypothetical protein